MNRKTCSAASLAVAAALACVPAHAQDGTCKPLADAMVLLAATPNHQHIAETAAYKPGTSESEVIETGSTRYIKVHGKWSSHAYDAKAEAAEISRATPARKATCTNAGRNDIDGQAAVLLRVHESNDDDAIESQVWIGAHGLPLRQVIDMDVGGKLGKSHREIRYDYADVQPPKM